MLDTLVMPLLGGVLIGLAAVGMMAFVGRIAGISGILGGLLTARGPEIGWRALFIAGLVVGGGAMALLTPEAFTIDAGRSLPAMVVAGLLVGFGTRLGSGCTSGHGVCGISRLSPRSFVAVVTFMASGMLTVAVIDRLLGGSI